MMFFLWENFGVLIVMFMLLFLLMLVVVRDLGMDFKNWLCFIDCFVIFNNF